MKCRFCPRFAKAFGPAHRGIYRCQCGWFQR